MVILCHRCGRPVAELEPPTFERAQVSIVRRTLSGLGLDLGESLESFLNPTAEKISSSFQVRCVTSC